MNAVARFLELAKAIAQLREPVQMQARLVAVTEQRLAALETVAQTLANPVYGIDGGPQK
jgi:hypothetical protein